MRNEDREKAFGCFVEIDETYVGGKPRKGDIQFDKEGQEVPTENKEAKRGRGTKKPPVIVVKESSTKRVYAQVAR
jgi:hypothetical protein